MLKVDAVMGALVCVMTLSLVLVDHLVDVDELCEVKKVKENSEMRSLS